MKNNKKNPLTLSSGANNAVIALSENEVGKLFNKDTRSDIGSESEKMKFANSINGLVVKFIRIDYFEELKSDILIMERIYPLDFRCFEIEKRELWFEVFESELKVLHTSGFAHRDIKRPEGLTGEVYDNILLTDKGIRLIDVAISGLKKVVGDKLFYKYVEIELNELYDFKEYFLNR